jgi:hypothetical protein
MITHELACTIMSAKLPLLPYCSGSMYDRMRCGQDQQVCMTTFAYGSLARSPMVSYRRSFGPRLVRLDRRRFALAASPIH